MTITEKAMLAGVKISMWSARKLDRKVTDETNLAHNANADAGRYNKALLSSDALAEIVTIAGRARKEHYARTLPWADNGNRILSAVGYAEFASVMRGLGAEFDSAVDRFVAGYPAFVDDARVRLNGMFDASDYPDASDVRSRFSFKRQIWPMPDAADFRVDLSAGESQRIRDDIAAEFASSVQMATRDIFQRIAETVGHMAEKLKSFSGQPGERMHESLVGNVRDLVKLLPSLNITGDATLTRLTERMEASLCQYDKDALRDDANLRKVTADAAAEILREVSDFMA